MSVAPADRATPTTNHRIELEKRPAPWWLALPAVAGLAGLATWQMIGVRHHAEDALRAKSEGALKAQFPGASLRFHGRDAIVSGLIPVDRAAAHNLVRDFTGVRNVKETVGATVAPAASTTSAPPRSAPTTSAPTTSAPATSAPASSVTTAPAKVVVTSTPTTVVVATTAAAAAAAPTTLAATTSVQTTVAPTTIAPTTVPATTVSPTTTVPETTTTTTVPEITKTTEAPTTEAPTIVAAKTTAPATPVEVGAGAPVQVAFDTDSCVLNNSATSLLDDAAAFLRANPDARASLHGFTDDTGTRVANLAVSACRADAVRAGLVARGVSTDRLSARGFGSRSPVASNATAAGRAANRRVDITFFGGKQINYTG